MKLYTVVFLVLLIASCKQPQKQIINNECELFRVGYDEIKITDTIPTLGAAYYMKVCGKDSVCFKLNTFFIPSTGELETKSYTYKLPLDSLFKQQMAGAIKTIENKGFKDGRFPNNKIRDDYFCCNCGNYILTYKDSLGKHRKFNFRKFNLEHDINSFIEVLSGKVDSLAAIKKSNTTIKIKTDSIAKYYFGLPCMKDMEKLPPPLKSTVKFEPPPITSEN